MARLSFSAGYWFASALLDRHHVYPYPPPLVLLLLVYPLLRPPPPSSPPGLLLPLPPPPLPLPPSSSPSPLATRAWHAAWKVDRGRRMGGKEIGRLEGLGLGPDASRKEGERSFLPCIPRRFAMGEGGGSGLG
eukprot:9157401-Pyramimonas_sp.AAC.1